METPIFTIIPIHLYNLLQIIAKRVLQDTRQGIHIQEETAYVILIEVDKTIGALQIVTFLSVKLGGKRGHIALEC